MRFFTGIILLIAAANLGATTITGVDTIIQTFDFSSPDSVDPSAPDLWYFSTTGGPCGLVLEGHGADIYDAGVHSLSEVTEAPDTGYIVSICNPDESHVYCIITRENNYAKFKIKILNPTPFIEVSWAYQTDGTRLLETTQANRTYNTVSWGNIKHLYKK